MTDNITLPRAIAMQALDALETYKLFIDDAHILEGQWHWLDGLDNAQPDLKAELEQQAEPVGEVIDERGEVDYISYVPPVGTKLYTTPPQRKPLTIDELQSVLDHCEDNRIAVARAVEQAHNIKD